MSSSAFPHMPLLSSPIAGVGERGVECPPEPRRFVSWRFREKGQVRLCFSEEGTGVFPSPDHQHMTLSCSQEWLPPASEEGSNGEPGVLEFRDWGR